jgi:hypothetical protein
MRDELLNEYLCNKSRNARSLLVERRERLHLKRPHLGLTGLTFREYQTGQMTKKRIEQIYKRGLPGDQVDHESRLSVLSIFN